MTAVEKGLNFDGPPQFKLAAVIFQGKLLCGFINSDDSHQLFTACSANEMI